MGWLFNEPTAGERAARAAQERDYARHELRNEEMDRQREYDRERDWEFRNRNHKQAVFSVERDLARREGRQPRYYSPEEVPDLERPVTPIWELGWLGIALRLGAHAFVKVREHRAEADAAAAQAQQGYYPQQPRQGAPVQPGFEPGHQYRGNPQDYGSNPYTQNGYTPGPYPSENAFQPADYQQGSPHGAPEQPLKTSPAVTIIVLWVGVFFGLPVAYWLFGEILSILTGDNYVVMGLARFVANFAGLLAWVAAGMTTVRLILRHQAGSDPVRLAVAEKWRPLYWVRGRRARSNHI